MWTTGATNMIARVAGSTLLGNSNVVSIFGYDHRSLATSDNQSSNPSDKNEVDYGIIKKMRELRAVSPYALFVRNNYPEMSKKNPNLKMVDVSRKISQMWRDMPENEKRILVEKYEEQKVAYENEKKKLSSIDLQQVNINERAKRLETRVRKSLENLPLRRPRSAFIRFAGTLDRGEASIQDFMRAASKRWALLPIQEKQKYEQLYHEDKAKYAEALVTWAIENQQKSVASASPTSNKTDKEYVDKRSSSPKAKVEGRSTSPKQTTTSSKRSSKNSSKAKADSDDSSSSSDSEEASSQGGKKSNK